MPYIKVNSINLYYEIHGDMAAQQTVVFLNGVMVSTSSWERFVPRVTEWGAKVLLHDFRGQLMSDKPDEEYSFEQHVEDLKVLLDSIGIHKIHIVGTSYGGEIGMKFALKYPDYVCSLIIIDSTSETDEAMELVIKNWISLAEKKNPEDFFWGMAADVYGKTFLKEKISFLKTYAEMMKKIPEAYYDGQIRLYRSFLKGAHFTEQLQHIKCPALIVCGDQDFVKPVKYSKIIADNIKNSEFLMLPDCGHSSIFEKPAPIISAMVGFLAKHSGQIC